MAQTACNLLDHVLPLVPLRQWVLTVPHPQRQRIAYDRELLAKVGRIFISSVLRPYRRRLTGDRGKPTGQSGAVVVVQRTSSDLKLNPHFHAVFLDGIYLPGENGTPLGLTAGAARAGHTAIVHGPRLFHLRARAGEQRAMRQRLTGEYFGYHHDLPRRERELAAERWAAWWRDTGHRRFSMREDERHRTTAQVTIRTKPPEPS